MCFSFPMIFSFLYILQVLQCAFLIFHVFECFLPYAKSYSICVSFTTFFSFLDIFQVMQCLCFIFHVFDCFWPYSRSYSVHFSFFTFFSDFVIFQVVKWIFLIFHDFQFSCHYPCPTLDISKLSNFFSFPRHISRPKVCISHVP